MLAASPISSASTTLAPSENPNKLSEIVGTLTKNGEPKAKRQKLKGFDLVSAQMLNCMGASGVETVTSEKLAKAMSKGNKMAIYFTEFCDELGSRKGIAVSRLAEVQLAAGERLDKETWKTHLGEVLYKAAMLE